MVSGGQRVPDRVRHSRKISRLDVASQAQASKPVELGRYARVTLLGELVVLTPAGWVLVIAGLAVAAAATAEAIGFEHFLKQQVAKYYDQIVEFQGNRR